VKKQIEGQEAAGGQFEKILQQGQMPRAADRQKLRYALNGAEH
jgi:hypothetical protein